MNPIAVVTGATKGIGRAIAEIFAQNGFDVFVCARTVTDLEKMKLDWSGQYPDSNLYVFPADLGKKDDLVQFAEYIKNHTASIDVLVNNAGLFLPGGITDSRSGTLETLMETNVYSAYHLTRALLPAILKRGKGHVFNMCSVASLMAYPNGSIYSITKYALLGFSKSLRLELQTKGIKVTSIMPGATWSDSWAGVDLPEERLMQPSDIAKTVWAAYSLSDVAVVEDIILRPQLGDL